MISENILKRLREKREEVVRHVANGVPKTNDEYRFAVGIIKGLNDAIKAVREVHLLVTGEPIQESEGKNYEQI